MSKRNQVLIASLLAGLALPAATVLAAGEKVIAWNNLGMHCMDSDYAVFSILPPYNTVYAQVVGSGGLVTDPTGLTVTYQAVADPSGSTNTTSVGKTGFWEHVQTLFGVDLAPDEGLAGFAMPGTGNQPRAMSWDAGNGWFVAEGIPITPYDDQGHRNAYPMMRVTVQNTSGQVLATTDIVLPVSDEMDCRACHASGASAAAQPSAGWANDPNPDRDYRRNVLRLHDDLQGGSNRFQNALATAGYSSTGLEATVDSGTAVLCARCHASNALPGTGVAGLPPLTAAVHGRHASVTDPTNGLDLDSSSNRSACYRCHPGSETRCLRGAMGSAVATDGSLAIQCQSCHGSMSQVGSAGREGWLDEPGCGSCHTGTATANSGQIRYPSAFDAADHERVPADRTFATNQNAPTTGYSLYRFSVGHGGFACEACHGSTHAEYPSSNASDNLQSAHLQGHTGTISDCTACHGGSPSTVTGGPHGMHPVGQAWVGAHSDVAEHGAAACQTCHGSDYRGTVLSRALGDRTLSAFGSKTFWRGYQVGCYSCHNGPSSEEANPNRPPTATNRSATTAHDAPVTIALSATDADGDALTLRVVSQAIHGTVGLSGTTATYSPLAGFGGSDSFTYAAWDGQANSNLATVTISVTPAALSATATASPTAGRAPLTVYFSGRADGGSEPLTYDWDFGDGTAHSVLPRPTHVFASAGSHPVTLTVRDAQGGTAAAALTIAVLSPDTPYRYLIPAVAHNPGVGGTLWRTDVAAVNLEAAEATVAVTFRSAAATLTATEPVPSGGAVEWLNVVEDLLGADSTSSLSGALELVSDQPLYVTARTFNDTPGGSYGQSMPALTEADSLLVGEVGVLPQLRGNLDFRTNLGAVNLGQTEATVHLRLFDGGGAQVGDDLTMTIPTAEWRQANNVFSSSRIHDVAFATVELTAGDAAWVYGSLVDERTGDPTTIAVMKR